jgi:predicted DNA-binding transcriptional regulator AlpA
MEPMPDAPEPEETQAEEGRLVNLSQLAQELGVTRQWLHNLRVKDPEFPQSQRKPGSTREVWDLSEARAYYEGRELRPGERTDLKPKAEE